MKVSMVVSCMCGHRNSINVVAGASLPDIQCGHCHAVIYGTGKADIVKGVYYRACKEVADEDFALAVVLFAMALDCKLALLYVKWRHIAEVEANRNTDKEALEDEFRRFRTDEKLDKVAKLLFSVTLNEYVSARPSVVASLQAEPSLFAGSFKSNLHERVFKPRNQILHFGRTADYHADEALRTMRAAAAALTVFDNMDKERGLAHVSELTGGRR